MTTRAEPFYCPFCGDEDLHPSEAVSGAVSPWGCRSCRRVFTLTLVGLDVGGVSG